MREKDGSDREEEEEREAIKGRSGALSRGEASPSKADLARRAVVRRGHPEATTKLGTAVDLGEVSLLPLSMSHHCLLKW